MTLPFRYLAQRFQSGQYIHSNNADLGKDFSGSTEDVLPGKSSFYRIDTGCSPLTLPRFVWQDNPILSSCL